MMIYECYHYICNARYSLFVPSYSIEKTTTNIDNLFRLVDGVNQGIMYVVRMRGIKSTIYDRRKNND